MVAASIAFHLAEMGRSPVVYERNSVHASCATTSSAGVVRVHNTAWCDVPLAWQSRAIFASWAERVGGDCGFQRTGFAMLVGPECVHQLHQNASVCRSLGVAVSVGGPDLMEDLFPSLSSEGVAAVAFEPDSGWADPRLTMSAFFHAARARGASVVEGVEVRSLTIKGDQVTGVQTSMGRVSSDSVVLANNYGANKLLKPLPVDLGIVPRRIAAAVVELPPEAQAPRVPACIDDTIGTYFRPGRHAAILFGVPTGRPACGSSVSPISRREFTSALRAVSLRLAPVAAGHFRGAQVAADGYTADNHPVVGPINVIEGLYVAAGFSGGGFKLAPAVGELVAQELTSATCASELEPFRPSRFTSGRLIANSHPYIHS